MNTLVSANVKTYRRRFAAVIAAVTIGVAFLTATLFVSTSIQATLKASVGQDYTKAQLVAETGGFYSGDTAPSVERTREAFERDTSGNAVLAVGTASAAVTFGDDTDPAVVSVLEGDPTLLGQALLEGRSPGAGEASIDRATADKRQLSIGSSVDLAVIDEATGKQSSHRLTVTGIREASSSPGAAGQTGVQLTAQTAATIGLSYQQTRFLANTAAGTTPDTEAISAAIVKDFKALGWSDPSAGDAASMVADTVAEASGGVEVLSWVLYGFALIALVVTALVVSNTFSVILAQRIREMALLRTIGAKRSQLRRMVLGEAVVIGLMGSVAGVALGTLVVWAGAAITGAALGLSYVTFGFSPVPLLIGLLVGLAVTLLASLRPVRTAVAVAPLAALAPQDAPVASSRKGKTRITIGSILVVLGAAGLLLGAFFPVGKDQSQFLLAFGVAFLGGLVSFVGVLMVCSFLIPWAVRQASRPFSSKISGRLAGLNAVRQPQRTAAIGTALLLGVTLVSLFLVGASTARATLDASLRNSFPIDIQAVSDRPFTQAQVDAVSKVPGIEAVAQLHPVGSAPCTWSEESSCAAAFAADPAALKSVVPEQFLPADGKATVEPRLLEGDKSRVTVLGAGKLKVELPVDPQAKPSEMTVLMSIETAKSAGLWNEGPVSAKDDPEGGLSAGSLWAKAVPGADPTETMKAVAKAAGVDVQHVGGALQLSSIFAQVINTLLLVVSALLAVAVVIALIGVSNTLSLSVLERTRENSLLRALGLTKRQLRGMLALEAGLIAGAAALLGVVIGSLYGLAGGKAALSTMQRFVPAVPWGWLALILAVAIAAAVIASLLPARRAARISPVEGLAVE